MFCECGTMIHFPTISTKEIVCKRCLKIIKNYKASIYSTSKSIVRKYVHLEEEVLGAKINMECAKCGNGEMIYNTAQLRSADEGQTVFYRCEKCGYKEIVQS